VNDISNVFLTPNHTCNRRFAFRSSDRRRVGAGRGMLQFDSLDDRPNTTILNTFIPRISQDHLALIIELVRKFPKKMKVTGKYAPEFFNKRSDDVCSDWSAVFMYSTLFRTEGSCVTLGSSNSGGSGVSIRVFPLRILHIYHHRIHCLVHRDVLLQKYRFHENEAEAISAFLTPLLAADPGKSINQKIRAQSHGVLG
jgi:hypothetical protein